MDAKILDAGAGEGYWAQKLIEIGYNNITLLDISQNMLEKAKKRLSKKNMILMFNLLKEILLIR